MIKRLRIPCLFLIVAALACNAPVPETVVQIVTATPLPATVTVRPTPPPTATITPTLPPTATVVPQTAVDQATLALRNGDYASAVRTYRAVLDQPLISVNPVLRASASFSAGQAALREGLFTEAVTELTQFIQIYANDPRVGQAYFLRGDAYLGSSQWQAAIDDFGVYLQKRPGLLDSYTWERIGDAQLALGAPTDALTAYGKAAQGTPRSLVPLFQLREKVATASLNAGDVTAAVAQYDEILKLAKNAPYRASIAYAAALSLAKSGNAPGATARYQAIVAEYPTQPEAYKALIALLNGGASIDELTRGRIAFAAGDWGTAIQALNNHIGVTAADAVDPFVFIMLGRSYRETGNIPAAITALQIVIDKYPKSAYFGAAWIEQGRTLFLSDKPADAIARYKQLAEQFPTLPEGADALSRAAYLQAQAGDQAGALATYTQLIKQFPASEEGQDAVFKAGMIAWTQGDRGLAAQMFALLASKGRGQLKAAGAFWLGRLYQLANDPEQARLAYQESRKADPFGYYSQRSRDLLSGHGPLEPPARYDWTFNDPQKIAEADQWLRQTFKLKGTGELWRLSASLQSDPRKLRGDELWTMAAFEQARAEYAGLRDDNAADPVALYQLATYYYQIGLYREAISTAELLIQRAGVSPAQAPRYIAALAYPVAYSDLILPVAQKYQLDPLLVFALIRQESLYEGYAQSFAAAQGLMQIIPDTGNYIAGRLEWPNYQNSDLFRPYINVQFGIWYLKEQLDRFQGNKYAALAAYNAGPNASAEWVKISGGDPDLFVQAIEYEETQRYVRLIYEQYQVYAAIYGVN